MVTLSQIIASRTAKALELLTKFQNEEAAQNWLNVRDAQGGNFEVSQIDEIIEEYAKKKVKSDQPRKSRFNENQVREIREMRLAGKSLKEIALQFNCSTVLVSNIARNKLYTKMS